MFKKKVSWPRGIFVELLPMWTSLMRTFLSYRFFLSQPTLVRAWPHNLDLIDNSNDIWKTQKVMNKKNLNNYFYF